MNIPDRVLERVMSKVTPGRGGCWISTYSRGSHGYAQVGWNDGEGNRIVMVAHRAAWVYANRDVIPPGWTVDHICKVRACIRPSHLRLLINVDNARDNGQDRRSEPEPTGRQCKRGHELLLYATGSTACRECIRVIGRRKDALRRARRAA